MNYSLELIKIFFYLFLVLGLIYLIAYYLKKKNFMNTESKYLNIIERIYLSPKANLVLVRVKDKVLLLSLVNEDIRVLETWLKEEFPEVEVENEKNFKDHIREFIDKKDLFGGRRDENE